MGYKPALAALAAVAAAAVIAAGPSAHAATVTTTPETTSFTYAPGSAALTVAASNIVPPAGTPVAFNLEFAVSNAMPANSSPAEVAAAVTNVVDALEAAPFNVPAADFANVPVGDVLPAAGTETTVTLYSVDSTATSFEVSGTKGGVAFAIPATVTVGGAVSSVPAGSGMVTWNLATATKTVRPHLSGGHVITVDNNRAEIGWTDGPGVKYVLARTFGYGFSVNGNPHLGFTGSNIGYWAAWPPGTPTTLS